MRSRRRSTRRAFATKVIEVLALVAFLLVMINLVLPWTASYLSGGFISNIERPR